MIALRFLTNAAKSVRDHPDLEEASVPEKQIDQYRIYYYTGGSESPVIDCYDGTTHVGKLVFYNTTAAPPANAVAANGVLYLRYRLSQFNDVLNILQREKPLYIKLAPASLIGFLATDEREPVGEEET
jgi:hypothetical protein